MHSKIAHFLPLRSRWAISLRRVRPQKTSVIGMLRRAHTCSTWLWQLSKLRLTKTWQCKQLRDTRGNNNIIPRTKQAKSVADCGCWDWGTQASKKQRLWQTQFHTCCRLFRQASLTPTATCEPGFSIPPWWFMFSQFLPALIAVSCCMIVAQQRCTGIEGVEIFSLNGTNSAHARNLIMMTFGTQVDGGVG